MNRFRLKFINNAVVSDVDSANDTKYYGYVCKEIWYIMCEVESAGTYRYAFGSNGYEAAWANRANLTYDYFHKMVEQ